MRTKHQKHLSLLLILLGAFSFASCSGRLTPTPTPTAAPTPTPTELQPPQGWEFYSDYFVSNVGVMHYELYHPPDWYIYRGGTTVRPGSEDLTYIQSYARSGGKMDTGYQSAGAIKISIGAQTCTNYINCDTRDFTLLAPGFNGIRNIDTQFHYDSDGNKPYTTYWDICTMVGEFKFCMHAYLVGTPEENGDQITVLDQIMNTIILTYAPHPDLCD